MTPTSEEWRPVLGYEGLYEVSDHGRVRSLDRISDDGRGNPRRTRGRVMKASIHPSGRRAVRLYAGAGGVRRTVYTLVLETFVGPRPDGAEACHNDGDCSNDQLQNLRWDTRRENNLDRVRHGTHHNARKTNCPRGHPLQAPNLVPSALARGLRSCFTCARARRKEASCRVI